MESLPHERQGVEGEVRSEGEVEHYEQGETTQPSKEFGLRLDLQSATQLL
jgi:hypothetical protein